MSRLRPVRSLAVTATASQHGRECACALVLGSAGGLLGSFHNLRPVQLGAERQVRHFTDVRLCTPGDDQDVVGSAPSDIGHGDPVGRASAWLSFPAAWVALVAVFAVIGGVAYGFLAADEGGVGLWLLGSVVATLLLGVIGGALWPDPVKVTWMGALVWSVVLSISAYGAYYRGSSPEEGSGGLGLVIGLLFVITVIPMLAGALLGHELRRTPLAMTAFLFGGAALVAGVLWLIQQL